jgi:hypothetical protein
MKDDRIELGGEVYLSSVRAAEELGYTKDYVGQLARAGKIDAKLIGRSWYVLESSLREHKKSVHYTLTKPKKRRQAAPGVAKKASSNKDNSPIKEIPEESVIRTPAPDEGQVVVTSTGRDEVDSGTPLSVAPTSKPEVPRTERDLFVTIPIRTERPRYQRDPLVSSDIRFEPGEPMYYDDGPTQAQRKPEPVRFKDVPVQVAPPARLGTKRFIDIRPPAPRAVPQGVSQRGVPRRERPAPQRSMDAIVRTNIRRPTTEYAVSDAVYEEMSIPETQYRKRRSQHARKPSVFGAVLPIATVAALFCFAFYALWRFLFP